MQRRTAYLLIAVAAAAVAGVGLNAPQPTPAEPPPPAAGEQRSGLLAALPERPPLREPRSDLFAMHPAPPALAPAPQPVPQATSPGPPPMPYRFVGHLTSDGTKQHFLAKGDGVFPVKQGDTLEGAYRVEAVAVEEITLLYVPLGAIIRLSLAPPSDNVGVAAQGPVPAANSGPSPRLPSATQLPASSPSAPNPSGPAPIASQAPDAMRTAASGTRAAHLRRERAQQLGPIIP